MGHFYRLLALSELLEVEALMSIATNDIEAIRLNIPTNIEQISFEYTPEFTVYKQRSENMRLLVIADGYQFDETWFSTLKDMGVDVIYIDDLHRDHIDAKAIINHSPDANASQYSAFNGWLALGCDYALLRKPFLSPPDTSSKRKSKLLICIGGADPQDLSSRFANWLSEVEGIEEVHVLLGAAYRGKLRTSRPNGIFLHGHLHATQICELLDSCAIAIAPASTTALEICSRNVPLVCGHFTENQLGIYAGLVEKECILDAGDLNTIDQEKLYFLTMAGLDSKRADELRSNQSKLIDGKSGERLTQFLESIL